MNSIINITEAKKHLGEIAEEAHYLERPFLLKRGNKPLAAVIGSNVFTRVLDLIEAYDPGLADTLALMADPDLEQLLREGEQAIKKGEMVPFDHSLVTG
jgi:hypothetical protein